MGLDATVCVVGGLSVRYSLPYLQAQMRNIGLPAFLGAI
jgi:hypothetical protein